MEPILHNVTLLIRLASVASSERVEDIPFSKSCGICWTLVQRWTHIAPRVCNDLHRYTRHRGAVVIPYDMSEGSAAYLYVDPPYRTEIVPLDVPTLEREAELGVQQTPNGLTLAKNLAGALLDWAKCGFKLADDATVSQRKATCEACEFWKGDGYAGMGKCSKCGCSGVKLKLATSKCPIGKWDAVHNS